MYTHPEVKGIVMRIPQGAHFVKAILILSALCVCESSAQLDDAPRADENFLRRLPTHFTAGYHESLSGETISYHSVNEYVRDALLVRTTDGKGEISWSTEAAPSEIRDSLLTFGWMAGLAGSKGVHRFDMYLDDRMSLTFHSQADTSRKFLSIKGLSG